jgi:RND family efflux transporter MFP subunit
VFALGTAAAGLVALGLAGCGGHGAEPKLNASTSAPKAVSVTVTPLGHRKVERTVEVVGTLKGWEDVTVGTKQQGRVLKVHHDMGDRVKPGDLLVELESVDAELNIKQAERRLDVELAKLGLKALPENDFDVAAVPSVVRARASLDKARQMLARERSLIHRSAGTMQDFQNAESDERVAEAALADAVLSAQSTLANAQAARVALDIARQARKDLEIRAPIPSNPPESSSSEPLTYAVAKRSVSEGQMLRPGFESVMELVIEQPLRLWSNVPERHSAEVRVGQPVRIAVASFPGTVFEGKVSRINPAIDAASRTFQVETLVPNRRGLLRPGGFAKASILIDNKSEARVVPVESVVKYAGVTKVFVVENGKARPVNVETGLEGPGWVEVIGEIPGNAQVVTTGQTQLADGTAVTVRQPEPEAPKPGG